MDIAQYRKAVAAAVLQVVTVVLFLLDVNVQPEVVAAIDAAVTTLVVFLVRNAPA